MNGPALTITEAMQEAEHYAEALAASTADPITKQQKFTYYWTQLGYCCPDVLRVHTETERLTAEAAALGPNVTLSQAQAFVNDLAALHSLVERVGALTTLIGELEDRLESANV